MIRAMSSALSGLRNHQLMLDVVGNDIANVSTVGFKGSSTIFSDVLSQTLSGAGSPTPTLGGTNPAQVGLGSRLAGTIQSFSQGSLERTGRSSDLAIQGDGFFVVKDTSGSPLYTRAGGFTLDANGGFTTPDGMKVQGWQADSSGKIDLTQPAGSIQINVGATVSPVQTGKVSMTGNLSADAALNATNTVTVTSYDQQGVAVPINITFTKTNPNEWTASATFGASLTPITLSNNVLTFDGTGELTAPAGHSIDIAGGSIPGFANAMSFDLGAAGSQGRVTQYAGKGTVNISNQDGSPQGTLQSYSISQDGVIVGNYSNGQAKSVGQLAMAVFANPEGLERVGGAWKSSANSGTAQVGQAGAGGRGLLAAGNLEMSNVDLAEEFTRLIVAQRGFQGNARVITTSDEVLQEVVNLKH
jgi:flagellar hook protein FlgE